MKTRNYLTLAATLTLALTLPCAAEKITLKDGRVVETQGVTVKDTTVMAKVELQPGQVGEIGIPLDQIEKVNFAVPVEVTQAVEKLHDGKTIEAGAFADAAMKSQAATKKVPGSPWPTAALVKAQVLMAQGKPQDAKKLSQEVMDTSVDPETKFGAEIHLAAVDALEGKPAPAIAVYERVQKESHDPHVLSTAAIFMGQARLDLKQWEDALLAFLQIPVLYPDQKQFLPKALLGAGKAYVNLLDTTRAKASFTEVTTKFASAPEAEEAKAELKRIEELEKSKKTPAG
jgi:tetratricopeptide (TPR) repeat protein